MANTYISLYIHYVFTTTQRLPLIKPEIRKRSFQDEYLKILDKHGIEYDEKYLYD